MAASNPTRPSPSVLRMAAPLVVSFVLRGAFTLVDTVFAALLGDAAVAAIGLTVPFEYLMIALWVGLSTGLTSNLSRSMGAREADKSDQYLRCTWRLVLTVSPAFFLCGVAIWFWAPHMGLEAEVARDFRIYGSVLVAGSALTAFWSVIPDSIVKAHQDTRSTMWAGILSSVLNVALNTLFLFVFEWGVFGIAFSTVLGRIAGLVYALGRARYHENRRRREEVDPTPGRDPRPYRALLSLALPASLSFGLMAGETALVNYLLSGTAHATESIAAYSIYYRVTLFLLNPIIATAVAMLPFAARRYGEGDREGLRRGLRQAVWSSVAYSVLVVGPLMALLAPDLGRFLTESPVTLRYTTNILLLVPLACLTAVPFLLCRPVFEAMQQWRPGLVMAALRYLVLAAPGAWAGMELARHLEAPAIYGLVLGILAVAVFCSLGFLLWLRWTLRQEDGTPR